MRVFIFDLDETVIDSKHRTPNNADGTLNLAGYMAQHNAENVAKDELLPLAATMRQLMRRGDHVWILTARHMADFDYAYLRDNGIECAKIMSRDRVRHQSHYRAKDGEYKARWLRPLMNLRQFKNAHFIMFDDAAPVRTAMRKLGITCLNAIAVNHRLAIS